MSTRTELTAEQIRKSHDAYREAKRDGWEHYPIRKWGPYEYIVCDTIDLRPGEQTITVIDITGRDDIARFQLAYPEQGWDEESNRAMRRFALVCPPDEGVYWLVMIEGSHPGRTGFDSHLYNTRRTYAADLSIFVGSASSSEIDAMIGDIAWAVEEARQCGWTQEDKQIGNTIRAAARRGAIPGARQGNSGRWYFDKATLSEWLYRSANETRGRPSAIEDLITSGADARTIQRQLAEMTRQTTGRIPRGQLWQPCEHPDCDNEPVCMNCLMCQDEHCHCFDAQGSES